MQPFPWVPVLCAETVLVPLVFVAIIFLAERVRDVSVRARVLIVLGCMLVLTIMLEGVMECLGLPRLDSFVFSVIILTFVYLIYRGFSETFRRA